MLVECVRSSPISVIIPLFIQIYPSIGSSSGPAIIVPGIIFSVP